MSSIRFAMKQAFLQLHLAILLASCSGIFGNLISLDPVLITGYRMLLASVMLLLLLVIKYGRIIVDKSNRHILWLGVLLAFHWVFFYGSIKYANVSVGVVCFCLSGFFTALVSPLVNRKRISWVELLLSSLTLVGILLIFHFDASFRTGIVLGIISSLLFALYATLNERVNQSGQVIKTTALQMVGGTLAMGLLLPFYRAGKSSLSLLPTSEDFVFLFLLALGCTVCMCLLLNRAQKVISAFTVSLSFNLEPVYSILLAVLLFDEDKMLGTAFYIGLILIVLSLVLQMVYQKWSFTKSSIVKSVKKEKLRK